MRQALTLNPPMLAGYGAHPLSSRRQIPGEAMSVWPRLVAAIAVSWLSLQPAAAADRLIPVEVALGDVSLNKVPFLIAADAGTLYTQRSRTSVSSSRPPPRLTREQFGRRRAEAICQRRYRQPADWNRRRNANGLPRGHDAGAVHRVALLTTEGTIRNTIITTGAITRVEDLKGKRFGVSNPGTVTHLRRSRLRQTDGLGPRARHFAHDQRQLAQSGLKQGRVDGLMGSALTFSLAPETEPQAPGRSYAVQLPRRGFEHSGRARLAEGQSRSRRTARQGDRRSDRADEDRPRGVQRRLDQVVQHHGPARPGAHVSRGRGDPQEAVPGDRGHPVHDGDVSIRPRCASTRPRNSTMRASWRSSTRAVSWTGCTSKRFPRPLVLPL